MGQSALEFGLESVFEIEIAVSVDSLAFEELLLCFERFSPDSKWNVKGIVNRVRNENAVNDSRFLEFEHEIIPNGTDRNEERLNAYFLLRSQLFISRSRRVSSRSGIGIRTGITSISIVCRW